MQRPFFLGFFIAAACAAVMLAAGSAQAQDVKIGFILPMTGQQQSTGKQEAAAAKLYMAQHGDTVAGKKIELIVKDDGAVPDNTKRLAQELIVRDKVNFLVGFAITPTALAVARSRTKEAMPEGPSGRRTARVAAAVARPATRRRDTPTHASASATLPAQAIQRRSPAP